MTTSSVKTALPNHEDALVDVIVLAFGSDPPARWLYPDPHQYLKHFPDFVRAFGGRAFSHDAAFYVDGFAGASLWLPPGAQPDEAALIALLERSVNAEQLPQVFELLEDMARYHPTQDHWYLPMIGVDPARQGRGHGSTMLRDVLRLIDQDRLPAYLESTNPVNIPLYQRHGFELMGTINIADAPPMFPMLREARD